MLLAIGQVCTLHASFEKDIADFAAGHCSAVEIWLLLTKRRYVHNIPQKCGINLARKPPRLMDSLPNWRGS